MAQGTAAGIAVGGYAIATGPPTAVGMGAAGIIFGTPAGVAIGGAVGMLAWATGGMAGLLSKPCSQGGMGTTGEFELGGAVLPASCIRQACQSMQ